MTEPGKGGEDAAAWELQRYVLVENAMFPACPEVVVMGPVLTSMFLKVLFLFYFIFLPLRCPFF